MGGFLVYHFFYEAPYGVGGGSQLGRSQLVTSNELVLSPVETAK